MNIIVAGEMPLLEDLTLIMVESGFSVDAYLSEDLAAAQEGASLLAKAAKADLAIDLHNRSPISKKILLRSISSQVSDEAPILSSSMTINSTQAAAWVPSPGRVTGFGLLPPLKGGDTVEVALPMQSSEEVLNRATDFWRSINLQPVVVADSAGLVRPRIVCCIINEAITALMNKVGTIENIDKAMKLGTRYPYGPFEWADIIGLDCVLSVMEGLFNEWGDDRYRPAPLLRKMVAAGKLGQKSGIGFYNHNQQGQAA